MRKMADFGNHSRFTLRCFGVDVSLASVMLKNTIRVLKSFEIIRKAERQILNEKVRSINTSIKLSRINRYICINHLASVLDEVTFISARTSLKG